MAKIIRTAFPVRLLIVTLELWKKLHLAWRLLDRGRNIFGQDSGAVSTGQVLWDCWC